MKPSTEMLGSVCAFPRLFYIETTKMVQGTSHHGPNEPLKSVYSLILQLQGWLCCRVSLFNKCPISGLGCLLLFLKRIA